MERQTLHRDEFEIIVVVDGSTDGTVEFLERYDAPYSLRYIASENRDLSGARNLGNSEARGEIVLCLDDDMITAPELLAEHLRAHEKHPRSLIQGGLRIHDSVARTPYLAYEERLLGELVRDYEARETLSGEEIFGGNISLARSLLNEVGGFNEELRGLRNTDGELAHRLEERGVPIRYNDRALSYMTHMKDLEQSLLAAWLDGRSYVVCVQDSPESRWKLSPAAQDRSSRLRRTMRRLFYLRPRDEWGLSWLERLLRMSTHLAESLRLTALSGVLYRLGLDHHFWKGAFEESGGDTAALTPRPISILCYHNVSPTPCPSFRMYVLPPERFAEQMRKLKEWHFEAISLDALHGYLHRGESLPERPVVITFDDGYRDLKDHATPLLAEMGFHHTHFVNTGKLGTTTDWVEAAPDLPLMDDAEIRSLARTHGEWTDFQAHGRNHLACSEIDRAQIHSEVTHCVDTLEPLTSRSVRYFAYPYGDYDDTTPETMSSLPIHCSFSVDQGMCRPGQDPHLIPRVEIYGNDLAIDFLLKVRYGWSPVATTRRVLKELYKRGVRILGRVTGRRR